MAGIALFVSSCAGAGSQSMSDSGGAAPAMAPVEQEAGQAADEAPSGRARKPRAEQPKSEQVKLVSQDRSIIYTADMTVRAKDVMTAAETARRIVASVGGHLATEKSDTRSGDSASVNLTFKIPPAAYPGVLDRLGRELGKRESLRQNTEDVTEQVADVESRLRSSRAALDSLRTLLKKANTIGEVLDVEREVSAREADLEALQARQKTLASQTSMATLTLSLVGPEVTVEEPEDEPAGFLGGLRAGWGSLVTALKIGLTVLGALLPWLVPVVLVWPLVVFARRRARRGRASAAASAPVTAGPGQAGQAAPGEVAAPEESARRDTTTGHARETGPRGTAAPEGGPADGEADGPAVAPPA
ncbi:hypothetical protein GCM10017600_63770 [Streptosporangium carneum]|uniref:DUF4349 domain-containing protein n=1 Tax=Streptosporangium carneum TaxID=47481 RepID=A0A9W6I759_9ACTN|nr:hypothetical protein GCM10017600_63770 [Streptosporangium carneum]